MTACSEALAGRPVRRERKAMADLQTETSPPAPPAGMPGAVPPPVPPSPPRSAGGPPPPPAAARARVPLRAAAALSVALRALALLGSAAAFGAAPASAQTLPMLSIDSPSVTEGPDGATTTLVFTVEMSATSSAQVAFLYMDLEESTAAADVDFEFLVPPPLIGRIPAGATTTEISVLVHGDDIDEENETVVLELVQAQGAEPAPDGRTGTGVINDDDDPPSATIASQGVAEGGAAATTTLAFTVELEPESGKTVTIDYETVDGMATVADGDYEPASGTLTFAPGATSSRILVTVNGDTRDEGDETVLVRLSNAPNAALPGGSLTGTGTILNDDGDSNALLFTIMPHSPSEGGGIQTPENPAGAQILFEVTLNRTLSDTHVEVDYTLGGGGSTAVAGPSEMSGADYKETGTRLEGRNSDIISATGTITYSADSDEPASTTTFRFEVFDDGLVERDETVQLLLSNARAGRAGVNFAALPGPHFATIRDNDSVTVSIDRPEVPEGALGVETPLPFTVTLDRAAPVEVAVDYEVVAASSTAVAGTDYRVSSATGTVAFAPGATSSTIDAVTVLGDDDPGGGGTVVVELSNPRGPAVLDGGEPTLRGAGIILDDDQPLLLIDRPEVEEGEGPLVFTVRLSQTWTQDVRFNFETADGTATEAGLDYAGRTGTLTIMAGAATATIAITVNDDDVVEGDETVLVTLSGAVNATLPGGTLTGTGVIRDDDMVPMLAIGDAAAVSEGAPGAGATLSFTVTLEPAAGAEVTVAYEAAGAGMNPAEAGADFRAATGTVTFAAGATSSVIAVEVIGDGEPEPDEEVEVTLSGPTGGAGIGTAAGRGTIRNDDYELSVAPAFVNEGADGTMATLVFTVTLEPAADAEVTVDYEVAGAGTSPAEAGTDFLAAAGTLTFATGDAVRTVPVTVLGDDEDEGNETVALTLSNPSGAAIAAGRGAGTGRILDDDPVKLKFTVEAHDPEEGDPGEPDFFTVKVDRTLENEKVHIDYVIGDGISTATSGMPGQPGADYNENGQRFEGLHGFPTGATGTITYEPDADARGSTTRFGFGVLIDNLVEGDETVRLELSNPRIEPDRAGVVFDVPDEVFATIGDQQPPAVVSIRDSPSRNEGSATATLAFTVELDRWAAAEVTVDYRVVAADSTADAGTDYQAVAAGRVAFAPGETSKEIEIAILDDDVHEPDERVVVEISNPGGPAVLGSALRGTGTILDDDPLPTLSIDSPRVREGAGPLVFTVSLSPRSASDVTVRFETTASGTATAVDDYADVSRTLRIPAGAVSATTSVAINDDTDLEGGETVGVRLRNPAGAGFPGNADELPGEGRIVDDEVGPVTVTFTVTPHTVNEGASGLQDFFTVEMAPGLDDANIRLGFAVGASPSTARPGTDYRDGGEVLMGPDATDEDHAIDLDDFITYTPGHSLLGSTTIFRFEVFDDALVEGNETVRLQLVPTTTRDLVTFDVPDHPVFATIRDDDRVSVSVDSPSVEEGGAGTTTTLAFTVSLDQTAEADVGVDYRVLTASSTADAGTDYQGVSLSGTAVIAPGDRSSTIEFTVIGDNRLEGDEEVVIELSLASGTPARFPGGEATLIGRGRILNDDRREVSIDSPSVAEGAAGDDTPLEFTVRLSEAAPSGGATVDYQTIDETATIADGDYEAASGTLTFAPGATSSRIRVTVNGDDDFEGDETVLVMLSGAVNAVIPGGTLTGRGEIRNDDAAAMPMLVAGDAAAVVEGASGTTATLVFTVTLEPAAGAEVTVDYDVAGAGANPAEAGTDFVAAGGTLTFAVGATSSRVRVTVNGDDEDEEDETVALTLSNPSGAAIAVDRGTGRIQDDDTVVTFGYAAATLVAEESAGTGSDSDALFGLTVDKRLEGEISVLATFAGTADSADTGCHPGAMQRISFPSLVTMPMGPQPFQRSVGCSINNDGVVEGDEDILITLSDPEGPAGTRFVLPPGPGVIIIRDDDRYLTIDSPEVEEGATGTTATLEFRVSLSGPSSRNVSVDYETRDGTATAGADYVAASGTLVIQAGMGSGVIPVTVNGDDTSERNETIEIVLRDPVNAVFRENATRLLGEGRIVNDDAATPVTVTFTVTPHSVGEGVSGLQDFFTVVADQTLQDADIRLGFAVGSVGSTARSGTDYGRSGEAVLGFGVDDNIQDIDVSDFITYTPEYYAPRGSTTVFRFEVVDDDLIEGDEEVRLQFSATTSREMVSFVFVQNPDFVTIRDNEARVEISISDPPPVDEGAAGATTTLAFPVSLDRAADAEVRVGYRVVEADSTAVAGTDYQAAGAMGTVVFAAGATSSTAEITILGNDAVEPDRTVVVELFNPRGPAVLAGGMSRGAGTINDDDDRPTLRIDSPEAGEGEGSLVFTVSLSAVPTSDVTVEFETTAGGTATAGADYAPASRMLRIPAGATSTTASVTIINDDTAGEGNETVAVRLWNEVNARFPMDADELPGEGTILDDEPAPVTITVTPYGLSETMQGRRTFFRVHVDPLLDDADIRLDFTVGSSTSTATPGTDYRSEGWVEIDDGTVHDIGLTGHIIYGAATPDRSAALSEFQFSIINDDLVEGEETVWLELSATTPLEGVTFNIPGPVFTTIEDNEDPVLVLFDDPPSVDEDAAGATTPLRFGVSLDRAAAAEVRAVYRVVAAGTTALAGTDYRAAATGTVSFAPGATSSVIEFEVIDDDIAEFDEKVVIELHGLTGPARFAGNRGTLRSTGTILDDDQPEILVDMREVEVNEGASGTTAVLAFTMTLSRVPPGDVTFRYAVTPGTAEADDYGAPAGGFSGTLTIPLGAPSTTLEIPVIGDDFFEEDETVVVTLSNAVGATFEGEADTFMGTGRILNDDLPALLIDSPEVVEGPPGGTDAELVFTMRLSAVSDGAATFNYAVTPGTAAADDYLPPAGGASGMLTIPAGATSTTLRVRVVGDDRFEEDETVLVTLSNAAGAMFRGGAATLSGMGTILNDDTVTLRVDSPEVAEGGPGETTTLVFTVTLSAPAPAGGVTVEYETAGGTATDGVDFVGSVGTVVIPAGHTSAQIGIAVTGDDDGETTETVEITVSSPTADVVIPPDGGTGAGRIRNDDPVLTIDSPEVLEGALGERPELEFTVELDPAATGTVTVDWSTTSGGSASAGVDFVADSGTLTFPAGATSSTFSVRVEGDDEAEFNEEVEVELGGVTGPAGFVGGVARITETGRILNDDLPVFSIESPTADEGEGVLRFGVTLDRAWRDRATVEYVVTGGTATADRDFAAASGRLAIEAGSTSSAILVTVYDDDEVERGETVLVTLSNPVNAAFPQGMTAIVGRGTIRNDDLPALLIDSPSVREGASGTTTLAFEVRLDRPALEEVTVEYEVNEGTATAGADFQAATGTLRFAPSEISKEIDVAVTGDNVFELDETVFVELLNPAGATISRATGTGVIRRDEPIVSISSPRVPDPGEGDGATLDFRVTLDVETSEAVNLTWRTVPDGGTAEDGVDYTPANGTLSIPAGPQAGRWRTIRVIVRGDDEPEGLETVVVELSSPTGGAVFDSSGSTNPVTAEGTIFDAPTISIDDSPEVVEGTSRASTTLEFGVTLLPEADVTVTVNWRTTNGGTAATNRDFRVAGGTLTFPAGATSAKISVAVNADDIVERDETVEVRLWNPTDPAEFPRGMAELTARGTILNDDLPELSIGPAEVVEGALGSTTTLAFPVMLRPAPFEEVTVDYAVAAGEGGAGEATAGRDFEVVAGRLRFAPNEASKEIRVTVVGDNDFEDDETMEIELTNAVGATISRGRGTGTILRDEPIVGVDDTPAVPDAEAGETTRLVFVVRLDKAPSSTVNIAWRVVAGGTATAGEDYTAASGTLVIQAGETFGTIEIEIRGDDNREEGLETVAIELSNPTGGAGFNSSGDTDPITETGIIFDVAILSIDEPMADEGAGDLMFKVTLNPAATGTVTVDWRTTDGGTATRGDDFRAAGGTLRIPVGSTSSMFSVRIMDDDRVERDETVEVELSGVTGPAEFRGSATELKGRGTILNDDLPALSIDSPSVREGAAGSSTPLVFTVTLNPAPFEQVTVDYEAAGGTAVSGTDYQALPRGTLTFATGTASRTIEVSVIGDDDFENGADETVVIGLSNADGATISRGTGTGTILRDEPVVRVDSPRVRDAGEGATTTLAFTVTLDVPPSRDVTLEWRVLTATGTGLATPDEDFKAVSGTLVIPAGRTSGTIRIEIVGDDEREGRETVAIELSNPTGGAVFDDLGSTAPVTMNGTIFDADPRVRALVNALSGIGRAIMSNVVDLVWERAEAHRSGGGKSYAVVGGRSLDAGAFAAGGGAEDGAALRFAGALAGLLGIDAGSPGSLLRDAGRRLAEDGGLGPLRDWVDLPSGRDLVGRTRFAVSFDEKAEGPFGSPLTLWGRGNISAFESELDGGDFSAFSAEGEVFAVHFGGDYRISEDLLVGMAVGHTVGLVDYDFAENADGKGSVETELTSLHPYLHWMSPSGLGVWGSVGYGTGTAEVDAEGEKPVETDLTMEMAAAGVRRHLRNVDIIDLAVKADAFVARTGADGMEDDPNLAAGVSRLRLALEASLERTLPSGALQAGRFEIGARFDGGDAEEGAGVDIAAGFGHTVPRLGLELKGRGSLLFAHEDDGFKEWGLGLGLALDPGVKGRGLQFSLDPVWRAPASSVSMWDAGPGSPQRDRASPGGASLAARLGYGMGMWGDRALLTLFGELENAGGDDRIRLGAGLRSGAGGLGFDLYGERRDRPEGAEHSIVLKGRLGF